MVMGWAPVTDSVNNMVSQIGRPSPNGEAFFRKGEGKFPSPFYIFSGLLKSPENCHSCESRSPELFEFPGFPLEFTPCLIRGGNDNSKIIVKIC